MGRRVGDAIAFFFPEQIQGNASFSQKGSLAFMINGNTDKGFSGARSLSPVAPLLISFSILLWRPRPTLNP